MATTALHGDPVHTVGELPAVGSTAPEFTLTGADLSDVTRPTDKRVLLSIFPSLDTGVCASAMRRFNELAAGLDDTVVICASADLPFAMKRFCGAEGIENVTVGSAFRSSFGEDYGVRMIDGGLRGVFARAVVVLDKNGRVTYTQLVPEVTNEPDYDEVLAALE